MVRNLILLVVSSTLLFSCNQINKQEEQTTKMEQVNDKEDKSISLSVDPKVFILSQIPDTIKVIMTNDTITTGLRYQIENYER